MHSLWICSLAAGNRPGVTLTRDVLSSTVVFQGWGGDCSSFGTLATITLVMNGD